MAWLIAGTAGEGLEAGGETFCRALAATGYKPTTQRDFPSRIRGGDTTFTVRLTPEGHLVPPSHVDLALAFNETVLARIDARMGPGGLLLVDEGAGGSFVPTSGVTFQAFPFTALAKGVGFERSKNMVALGASAALLGVDMPALQHSVAEQFASKGDKVIAANRAAIDAGHAEAVRRFGSQPRFASPAPAHGPAILLSGNEAAALGALVAGVRVAAAYPITPASDILEFLTPRLQALGGVALQMEDEMAALNLLLGASFAGARTVTATSGPGLSLMTETIGLAGSTETPVVVIDCQRPGPSTGMPTKHGQEDLWHLIHGGAGEIVRIVLSPTNVEDAFYATSEAFRLSEQFRAPAFVALDQQASLFKQTVRPFDMETEAARHTDRADSGATEGSHAWDGSYLAYGDAGATPRRAAIPGEGGGRYYSNSTEHAANGFTNEDPKVRHQMVQRRLDRMAAIPAACHRPVIVEEHGPAPGNPAAILLAWGSTVEACREAAIRLARHGVSVRVVGIRLLWPFPQSAMRQALAGTAPILCGEANAMGQLARLVRSELPVHDRLRSVLQWDGRPVASQVVVDAVAGRSVEAASAASGLPHVKAGVR